MIEEYSSNKRKLRVKGILETLLLRLFMETNSITDVLTGLTKLVDKINEISLQCALSFSEDAHKVE